VRQTAGVPALVASTPSFGTEVDRAVAALRAGGLVGLPTETVYGLGANALDVDAVQRIFTAKGRPAYNPLIVHVPDEAAARQLAARWPAEAARLARRFWPGPLTLVLPKQPRVPDVVTAGLRSVALRVPSHPVALALLHAAAVPVAAPSANPSTQLSPTTADHVAKALGERVSLVLDAGPTTVGIESTVVDLTGPRPVLLRPGVISADDLEPLVGALARPTTPSAPDAPRPAPGMLDRHYAPRATLHIFSAGERDAARALAGDAAAAGARVGALLLSPLEAPVTHSRFMPRTPAAYARELYAALHTLDDAGCDLVLVEEVPGDAAWAGVRDRLERAAR
jgi:L-threonylcarbamoyladenylate synthase